MNLSFIEAFLWNFSRVVNSTSPVLVLLGNTFTIVLRLGSVFIACTIITGEVCTSFAIPDTVRAT
ncbi:hypothetical protein D3C78_1551150 [compost metagenome]